MPASSRQDWTPTAGENMKESEEKKSNNWKLFQTSGKKK